MAPPSGTYTIGPNDGSLTVRTKKAGVGAKMAHNLVLEAKSWSGTVTFNADDPTASNAEVTVQPSSLEVIDFNGGMKPLSDGDRKDIAKNINDKALQTTKYPDITFRSTSVAGGGSAYTVEGQLTITDQTKPATLDVSIDGAQVVIKGRVVQTDFGVKPYSAMLGALKIDDAVEVEGTFALPSA
ncbi:MAG: YceI family protein [Actinomycetota bacterium]|nr:YceI family protein [Actinomycetota bacterium]